MDGPLDFGMAPEEGPTLFDKSDLTDPSYCYLFLPAPPPDTSELVRRLNPERYYFACRWNYKEAPREFLQRSSQNGRTADAHPVDVMGQYLLVPGFLKPRRRASQGCFGAVQDDRVH